METRTEAATYWTITPTNTPVGYWTVSGEDLDRFTPEAFQAMKDELRRAAAEGLQVVTIEGITLTWHRAELS